MSRWRRILKLTQVQVLKSTKREEQSLSWWPALHFSALFWGFEPTLFCRDPVPLHLWPSHRISGSTHGPQQFHALFCWAGTLSLSTWRETNEINWTSLHVRRPFYFPPSSCDSFIFFLPAVLRTAPSVTSPPATPFLFASYFFSPPSKLVP